MAACQSETVNDVQQVPDPAISAFHHFHVALQMMHARQYGAEQCEDLLTEWRDLQQTQATTEQGKALKRAAAVLFSGKGVLDLDPAIIFPPFEKALADFITADEPYQALGSNPSDEVADALFRPRSNALFSLLMSNPQTIGQAREILRAAVHEMAVCELTVGGPLPDAVELALANILALLDRMDPNVGAVSDLAGKAVRS